MNLLTTKTSTAGKCLPMWIFLLLFMLFKAFFVKINTSSAHYHVILCFFIQSSKYKFCGRIIANVFCFSFFSVSETAMGVSVDALSKPNSEYVRAVKE